MRPAKLRRAVAAAASTIVLAGAGVGYAARADAAPSVCGSLAVSPTVGTVESLVVALVEDGWTPEESGEILAVAVDAGCPQHWPVLMRFISKWSDAKPVRA